MPATASRHAWKLLVFEVYRLEHHRKEEVDCKWACNLGHDVRIGQRPKEFRRSQFHTSWAWRVARKGNISSPARSSTSRAVERSRCLTVRTVDPTARSVYCSWVDACASIHILQVVYLLVQRSRGRPFVEMVRRIGQIHKGSSYSRSANADRIWSIHVGMPCQNLTLRAWDEYPYVFM